MDLKTVDGFFASCANDETIVHLNRLSIVVKKEILEEMQDWETYMYCKEAQERLKANATPVEDLPPVRCSSVLHVENYIRFKISDEESKTKGSTDEIEDTGSFYSSNESYSYNYSNVPFSSVEIRCRENWDEECGEYNEEEKERKILDAKIQKAKGNEAYSKGDYKKACEHYSNCIAYGVNCLDAYNNRAQANIKLKNFASAIPDLNEVLEADPKNEKALFRRATCRKQLKMYREALKDLDDMLKNKPSSSARRLQEDIANIIPTLKGKSYRLRENFRNRETFQVDESQLPAYAEVNRECLDYLMEIDKTGCLKSCVCNYCTDEDRLSSQSSNSLRIGNRPRWAAITFKLLDEMKITHTAVANSADHDIHSKEKTKISATANKNEHAVETNEVRPNRFTLPIDELQRRLPQSRQHSEKSVEHLMKDLSVTNNVMDTKHPRVALKEIQPRLIGKGFGDVLNETILTNIMNSVCTDFDHTKEWSSMSEYLKEVACLNSFNHYITLVDKRTRNDVSNILDSATQQNLVDADHLKKLYNS